MTQPADFDLRPTPSPPSTAEPRASAPVPGSPDAIADGVQHPLDPRYLMLQRRRGWINAIVYSVVWLLIGSSAVAFSSLPAGLSRWLVVLWAALSIAYAVWSQRRPVIEHRHASYRLDARGIEIRGGVFWRHVINVPRSRVQHIDVTQGPFERRHGIGTLSIYTAGVSHAMVSLPGLDYARALRIRDYLLPREEPGGL